MIKQVEQAPFCAVYDARGNGEGTIVNTITGDHQNRITDYTALVIQETTGTLAPGAHAGSYNGQDAYNDMLVVDNELLHRERTDSRIETEYESGCAELYARSANNYRGGV